MKPNPNPYNMLMNPTPHPLTLDLESLRVAFLEAAAPDTAYDPAAYPHASQSTSRLWGHCYVVARFIQNHFGGDLLQGRVNGVGHYWNRLPDGREIDLTSCQFPEGDGLTPLAKGRRAGPFKGEPARLRLFEGRVLARLR